MEEDLRNKAPKIDSDTLFIVKGGTIDPVGSESNLLGWKKNGASSETKKPGYIPIPKYFFVAVLKRSLIRAKTSIPTVPSATGSFTRTRHLKRATSSATMW